MLKPDNSLFPWEGTMPSITLSGTPHEVGRKHGAACKRWIKQVVNDYWQTLQSPSIQMSREEIHNGIKETEQLIIQYTDPNYLEEIRGIAEGADLEYEDIFLANCGADLMYARSDPEKRAEMFSRFERVSSRCASFAAWGNATEKGEMICTHNNDGPRYPAQFQVAMIIQPEEGYAFISATTVGKVGQHSMMNSQGLSVIGTALDNGPKAKVEQLGVPLDIIFRYITEHCGNTDQAVEVLESLPLTVAGNFFFADKSRNIALVQATPQFRVTVKPETDRDYLLVTNHAVVEEIKPYLDLRPLGSTHYRYETMQTALNEDYGRINVECAKRIMSSHYDASVSEINPCENSPCRHHEYNGELGGTNRCSIWNLDKGIAHISLGNPCKDNWISISNSFETSTK